MLTRGEIEKISKALGDRTRLKILQAISRRGEMNCSEIVAMRGVTAATVSHHLKILAGAALIESRRRGQFVYSKPVPETMKEFTRSLARITAGKEKK